jgi:hypothetical protein
MQVTFEFAHGNTAKTRSAMGVSWLTFSEPANFEITEAFAHAAPIAVTSEEQGQLPHIHWFNSEITLDLSHKELQKP